MVELRACSELEVKAYYVRSDLETGYISCRGHNIEADQVRKVTDLFSYRQAIARLL